jgi:hypothetical protein
VVLWGARVPGFSESLHDIINIESRRPRCKGENKHTRFQKHATSENMRQMVRMNRHIFDDDALSYNLCLRYVCLYLGSRACQTAKRENWPKIPPAVLSHRSGGGSREQDMPREMNRDQSSPKDGVPVGKSRKQAKIEVRYDLALPSSTLPTPSSGRQVGKECRTDRGLPSGGQELQL